MNFFDKYQIEDKKRLLTLNQHQKRILALMCLERQFCTYRKFTTGQVWSRIDQYRELMDKFWTIVLNDLEMDDSVWYFHEKIRADNLCNGLEDTIQLCIARIFANHIEEWIDYFIDNPVYEEAFRLFTLDFILVYLNEEEENFEYDKFEKNLFIIKEMEHQIQDERNVKEILNFEDAKQWYHQCESIF